MSITCRVTATNLSYTFSCLSTTGWNNRGFTRSRATVLRVAGGGSLEPILGVLVSSEISVLFTVRQTFTPRGPRFPLWGSFFGGTPLPYPHTCFRSVTPLESVGRGHSLNSSESLRGREEVVGPLLLEQSLPETRDTRLY